MTSKILRTLVPAALVVMAVALVGCASSGAADPAAVEGTWVLEAFGGTQDLTPADPTVTTEMTLKAGEASGNGGVNSFSGTYEAKDDGSMKFGPTAATMMAGSPAAMEQEAAFFKALEKTDNFEINEGKLVLSDLGNNTLAVMAPK